MFLPSFTHNSSWHGYFQGERILRGLVDTTTRSGYSLLGAKPRTPHEIASEYYQFDWEYAQTPEQSSWLASTWVTYQSFIRQSRLLFRSEMIKSPTRSQIVLVCIPAAYLPHSRQIISPLTVTKAAFPMRTY
jgi:polyamine oxidase